MDPTTTAAYRTQIAKARLPDTYEAAKTALARCDKIDECQDWANKAEALASYARQVSDDSMRQTADRIQARAIRRCGELLKAIEAGVGGRPAKKTQEGTHPSLVRPPTRTQAATDAGLSEHQRKTALRVAAVPDSDFDAAVESTDPPTVTQLAECGKKPGAKRSRREAEVSKQGIVLIRDLWLFAMRTKPSSVIGPATGVRRDALRENVPALVGWLNDLLMELGE